MLYVLEAFYTNGDKQLFGMFPDRTKAGSFAKTLVARAGSMVVNWQVRAINQITIPVDSL